MSNCNLIVGSNSQLAFYLKKCEDQSLSLYDSIEDDNYYKNIYLLAAEQRTFLNLSYTDFQKVNVEQTIKLVEKKIDYCEKIYLFFTGEFWNNCSGEISLKTNFNFKESHYVLSKLELYNKINQIFPNDERIIKIFPFNFNSTKRNPQTLMGKIFETIIHKKRNKFTSLNFNRDICHTKYVANSVASLAADSIIASGFLTNIKTFTYDLCDYFEIDKELFELSDEKVYMNEFYYEIQSYTYEELLDDTIQDIKNCINLS